MYKHTAYSMLFGLLMITCSFSARAISQIEASGFTDLDGNFIRENITKDSEPNPPATPFDRSIVAVQAGDPNGLFYYSSSADIGLLELKVFGKLDNTAESGKSNREIGVLHARAELDDVISLQTDLTDPYDVTFELNVDGLLSISGVDSIAGGFAAINFGPTSGADAFDSSFYANNGAFSDTLSVTKTFTGNVDADIGAFLSFTIFAIDPNAIVIGEMNNTASINLILPRGVSLAASESGTFGVTIVPVPGALSLFLLGAGMTLVNGLRRKSA